MFAHLNALFVQRIRREKTAYLRLYRVALRQLARELKDYGDTDDAESFALDAGSFRIGYLNLCTIYPNH